MLLAHAPAGYLVARFFSHTLFKNEINPVRSDRLYQLVIMAGIIGGIAPDFDFFYFILDSDKTSHHAYITHIPIFWAALLGILALIGKIRNDDKITIIGTIFCMSAFFHMILDTLTGVIYWCYPFSMIGYNIFKVADVHIWWVHNYMYHWTFLIEIFIILTAMVIFLRVKETVADICDLFKTSEKLRIISVRLTICTVGIVMIVLVGSLRFNIDNRFIHKMKRLQHVVVQLVIS